MESTWPALSFELEGCGVQLKYWGSFSRGELKRGATGYKESNARHGFVLRGAKKKQAAGGQEENGGDKLERGG